LEGQFQGAVGVTGGKVSVRRTEVVGELRLTNAAFTGLRMTNRSTITTSAGANAGIPLILSQCQLLGSVDAVGYSVHIGFSKGFGISITDGSATLIGNQFRKTGLGNAISSTRSSLAVKNCDVDCNPAGSQNYQVTYAIGIYSSKAVIENCLVSGHTYYWNPPHPISAGIDIQGDDSNVSIIGCIITAMRDDGGAQGPSVRRMGNAKSNISYCCLFPDIGFDGTVGYQSFVADPKLSAERTLAIDSPCRNAGPPDAIYNDRDGTRNDIGFTGGPLYNPANFTTDNPMAFWLDTTPRKVLKGVNNTIRVDAAAVAGQ
jgi:hypothetical protein